MCPPTGITAAGCGKNHPMKRRSLLHSSPLLLLTACRADFGEHVPNAHDDPNLPEEVDAGSVVALAADRAPLDAPRCESDEDCAADEDPVCFEGTCVPCSPQTNEGCIEGEYCSPTRMDCLPGCDDVADCGGFLCADGECTDYVETTPICNYLERGINDFSGASDRYALAPVNVRTLADVDRLAFGEDIPPDRCLDANHSYPCTDKDIQDGWCIHDVEVTVLGFTLFSAAAQTPSGCLLTVHGGISGIEEITRDELRSNESWGFNTEELLQLFQYVAFDEEGNIGVVPAGYTIPGDEVARLIEGIIGVETAAYNKGEANATYHDNRRGVTVFPARETNVDCDFGGCPATSARSSSPWVELRKTEDGSIAVDIDLEFLNNTYDPGDCLNNPETGWDCGNLDTSLGHGSLGFEVDVVCAEMDDESYAVQVTVTEPTFEPEGGIMKYTQELCGFAASFLGGAVVGVIGNETWCEAKAAELDPVNIFAEKLGDSFSQNLLRNLDSCPDIVIGDDGTISFGTQDTISCTDPECLGQPARVAPDVTFDYDATRATVQVDRFVDLLKDVAPPPQEPLAGKEFSVKTIDQGMGALCALQATCDVAAMDFAALDFALLAEILQDLPQGDPPDTQDLGDLVAWLGPDVYAALQEFANQMQIQDHCVAHDSGNVELDNAVWLVAVWTAMTGEQCSNLPSFEALFPASLVEVRITSNGADVTDDYPFVDFSDPDRENWRALAGSACRHLYEQTYQPAPPSWQNCPDHDDPNYFGERGCPCADVDIFTLDDILEDGGRSDGAGSYRVHGQDGPGQFCDDDTATMGNEVVCGLSQTHHAECQECGLDTNLGCSCFEDSDCEGLEPHLTCIGDSGDGWSPGATGTCLPDANGSNAALESLAEMPWFCLESCGALAASGQMGCLYDQSETVALSHGQCVNVGAMADPQAWTTCAESGMFWEDDDVCAMECTSTADCSNRGFPEHFICDFEYGWSPGSCVPDGCQSMNVASEVFAFCELYR